jgi:predicted transcriptional regulator
MHAHSIQPNPYAAIDALRSAQKTAARREAELVRKELMESAAELAGESEVSDAYVARLEEETVDQRARKRRNHKEQERRKHEHSAEPEVTHRHLSDWA